MLVVSCDNPKCGRIIWKTGDSLGALFIRETDPKCYFKTNMGWQETTTFRVREESIAIHACCQECIQQIEQISNSTELLEALKDLCKYEGTVDYCGIGEIDSKELESAREKAWKLIDKLEGLIKT